MCRSTASTTMMASSTTKPIANTNPNRVRRLMLKPSIAKTPTLPINDTGTAAIGMIVARNVPRNRYTMTSTSTSAMKNVFITSVMDLVHIERGVERDGVLHPRWDRGLQAAYHLPDLLYGLQRVAAQQLEQLNGGARQPVYLGKGSRSPRP